MSTCQLNRSSAKALHCSSTRVLMWKENAVVYRTCINTRMKSRDSVVGIAASYGLDDRGVGV
jgi:hypothetical protein